MTGNGNSCSMKPQVHPNSTTCPSLTILNIELFPKWQVLLSSAGWDSSAPWRQALPSQRGIYRYCLGFSSLLCFCVGKRVKFKPTLKEMRNKGLHCPHELAGIEQTVPRRMGMAAAAQRMYPSSPSRQWLLLLKILLLKNFSGVLHNSQNGKWCRTQKVSDGEDYHTHTYTHAHTLTQKAGFTSKRLLLLGLLGRTLACPAREASAAPASSPDLCPLHNLREQPSPSSPASPFPQLSRSSLQPCPQHALLGRLGSKSLYQPCVLPGQHPTVNCLTFPSCKFLNLIFSTFFLL